MESDPNEMEASPTFEIEAQHERGLAWAANAMERFGDVGDEEAVFMLALTLDHPEWEGEMLRQVREYKPHVSDPEGLLGRIRADFEVSGKETGSDDSTLASVQAWSEQIPSVRTRLAEVTEYFRPADGEFPHHIILVPSDQIADSPHSGSSFHIGDTAVIVSHTGNLDNVGHEFLHGYINPITEKLSEQLPERTILSLASEKYTIDEMYGEHAISLLNEELIRTYNDVIRTGEALPSRQDFERELDGLTDESFERILETEPVTGNRLERMGIRSLDELRSRADEYYDRYVKNVLREKIFALYREYDEQKKLEADLNFRDFFERKIGTLFAE